MGHHPASPRHHLDDDGGSEPALHAQWDHSQLDQRGPDRFQPRDHIGDADDRGHDLAGDRVRIGNERLGGACGDLFLPGRERG